MNTNSNNSVNKANNCQPSIRACLLSFVPKSNAEHFNIADVWEKMSRFLAENNRLEIVYDFIKTKSMVNEVYQDKHPNRLDATKIITKMHSLGCDVLIIPTFASVAENPVICSDILMELHEAGIRIVSPYDAFDSRIVSNHVDKEAAEFMLGFRKALLQVLEKHIFNNVNDFETYVNKTRFKYKNAPFCITYGNRALTIPYSEEIRTQLFDFLDFIDNEYLHTESDDEDEHEDDEIPNSEYDEPRFERDFEG